MSKKWLLKIEKTRQGRRPKNFQSKFYVSKCDDNEKVIYDLCAKQGAWVNILKESAVNGVITVEEMEKHAVIEE